MDNELIDSGPDDLCVQIAAPPTISQIIAILADTDDSVRQLGLNVFFFLAEKGESQYVLTMVLA